MVSRPKVILKVAPSGEDIKDRSIQSSKKETTHCGDESLRALTTANKAGRVCTKSWIQSPVLRMGVGAGEDLQS